MTTDPLLVKYLNTRTPGTRDRVKLFIQHYITSQGMTPSELLGEAWKEQRGESPPWTHQLPQRLEDYKNYLEDKGMAESTVKAAVSTVRSFYHNHGITTPRTRLKYKKSSDAGSARTVDDLPGLDEIRRAFAAANTKFKSIILTMASSGMDASTLTTLNIGAFIEGLGTNAATLQSGRLDIDGTRELLNKSNSPVVAWKAVRPKMIRDGQGTYYTTFSTPEAIHSILDYLEAVPPRDQSVPLFRRYTSNHNKLNARNIFDYFRQLNQRCGWGTVGRQIYFRSHNLRKYFSNRLMSRESSMSFENVEYLLNHQHWNTTQRAYYKPDVDELRLEYLENMHLLSITEDVQVRVVTTEDLEDLEAMRTRMDHLERYLRDLERHKKKY